MFPTALLESTLAGLAGSAVDVHLKNGHRLTGSVAYPSYIDPAASANMLLVVTAADAKTSLVNLTEVAALSWTSA